MKILDIFISAKEIQQRVEHETVLIAKQRTDQQGRPLYDQLVMDADSALLFRSCFREAATKAQDKCAAYTKNSPASNGEDDANVMQADEDFYAILALPETFPLSVSCLIDQAVYNHLIAWVLFRWYETKLPAEAQIFRLRSEQNLSDLTSRLERRTAPVQRPCRPF